MNISDILFENPFECKLNMHVHVNTSMRSEDKRLEIGLVTFARSQYTIFDYDNEYMGFGGFYSMGPGPAPTPHTPSTMSPFVIILLIIMLILVIAGGAYVIMKYREKKLEESLLKMDAEGAARANSIR